MALIAAMVETLHHMQIVHMPREKLCQNITTHCITRIYRAPLLCCPTPFTTYSTVYYYYLLLLLQVQLDAEQKTPTSVAPPRLFLNPVSWREREKDETKRKKRKRIETR